MVNAAYRAFLKPVLRRDPDIDRIRGHLDRLAPFAGRPPAGTNIEAVDLGAFEAERILAAGANPRRFLLYIPGGAFVLRSRSIHRGLAARLGQEAGVASLLAFYRLASEHPFPAALDDCLTAYGQLRALGVPETNIVFAGDSSGGCLALAAMMALRDQGKPLPAGAVLLSPVTDLRDHRLGSRTDNAGSDSMLTMDATEDLHGWYVSGATEMLSNPLVSPVLGDLSGPPPLLFQVSNAEILLDDSLIAAERARSAGVECKVEVVEGVPHVWHAIPHLPESKWAFAGIGEFVRDAMAGARARQREEQVCTTPT